MAHIDKNNVLEILGKKVLPGTGAVINLNMAKLYTTTSVEVPVIIERSKKPGPVVLLTAGIHGDEINGVEIVRQVISKNINKPVKGTIICIPVVNVFGFLNMKREFPDGRDLNRVFPGTKNGSLASRFAFQFVKKILPVADFCLDFHISGASRFNVAQVRVLKGDEKSMKFAHIFNAPFTIYSKTIGKSYRETCYKLGKMVLLFEGGKSMDSNREIARLGVEGTMRILKHLGMLKPRFEIEDPPTQTNIIENSTWMRAKYSGLLHVKIECGRRVERGEYIATITDPYGKFRHKVIAPHEGFIINVNESPIVYQGDAIFHLSTPARPKEEADEG
ncbi:succinylglutamate desuccinylase/aspartoacylase family protein [Antarcticibacterium sp. 1MA-6-2]|uniref:succinylglutamate desuccinylase/aspartoacylase family protein n=1 Tax=Antarcticibacterium sp. 1MA-6-2 TaxID=2908210 RepID=UPI001F331BBD|nr:succinylglutamate desuccinylase/aspartoacylase family protein [Antarcticibacterium sp. 1MA-6-2]UJH90307.1 succinylglutamate desuccinylase/aspartoacylase family protein [Antarcticibacterium sp. 1MA-6-2]